jgi:hypothetical protein
MAPETATSRAAGAAAPEAPLPASNEESGQPAKERAGRKIALVFIHGIGVQDRYQQLTDFTRGLQETPVPGFTVRAGAPNGTPQGRCVPLTVVPDERSPGSKETHVDVYEVYWAPLLNGLTTSFSVIRWIALTFQRGIPWSRKFSIAFLQEPIRTNWEKESQRRRTPGLRWFGELAYVLAAAVVALFHLQWALGAFLCATNQLVYPREPIIGAPFLTQPGPPGPRITTDFDPYMTRVSELWPQGDDGLQRFQNDQGRRLKVYRRFAWRSLGYLYSGGVRNPDGSFGVALPATLVMQRITPLDLLLGAVEVLALYWLLRHVLSVVALVYRLFRRFMSPARQEARRRRAPGGVLDEEAKDEQVNLGVRLFFHIRKAGGLAIVFGGVSAFSKLILMLVFVPLVVFRLLYLALRSGLTNVIGDVQIYVTRNENSRKYAGREAVLDRTGQLLRPILASPDYQAVYVAGHSLGSVIGLDMLRRLYEEYAFEYRLSSEAPTPKQQEYERLKAFISFGSPLQKTLLFFHRDDHKSRFGEFNREVDWRVFHADLDRNATPPARPHCLHWFNFWIWTDVVCDPLGHYPIPGHHELRLPGHVNIWSHSDYWTDPHFVWNLLRIVTWPDSSRLNQLPLALSPPLSVPVARLEVGDPEQAAGHA